MTGTAGEAVGPGEVDARLLARLAPGDAASAGAAFEELVRRHGPLVLGVCRGVLRDPHDADDAFQATFLLLLQGHAAVRDPRSLRSWLYGTAARTARRERAAAARRRQVESGAADMRELTTGPAFDDDRAALLDEVGRLPDKYRAPVVLCYLDGRSNAEAAASLGWPVGTVSGRLARARELLRSRLVRRGVSAAALTVVAPLTAGATAPPSDELIGSTVAAGHQFFCVGALRTADLPPGVGRLVRGRGGIGRVTSLTTACVLLTLFVAAWAWQATAGAPRAAEGLLERVRDRYRRLESFSMATEHHDSSGAYPGEFCQTLRWRKDDGFVLAVSSGGDAVPDFLARAGQMFVARRDGSSSVEDLDHREVPWEATGGPILAWLLGSEELLVLPEGVEVTWAFGSRSEWRGQAVREVVAKASWEDAGSTEASFLVHASRDELVGVESGGWVRYSDQAFDPPLPPAAEMVAEAAGKGVAPEARALLREVAEATARAKSLSTEIVSVRTAAGEPEHRQSGRLRLARPSLYALDVTDGEVRKLDVNEPNRRVTLYQPPNRYRTGPPQPGAVAAWPYRPAQLFFDGWLEARALRAKPRLVGREAVDGTECRVLELTWPSPWEPGEGTLPGFDGPVTERWCVGPDGLVRRVTATGTDAAGGPLRTETSLLSVRLDAPLSLTDFAAAVPEHAVPFEEPQREDAERDLLPLGERAPDFALPGLDGKEVSLAALRDRKAVLVTFWFVGCGPCRHELAKLGPLYGELKGDGLAVVAVNAGDGPQAVRRFQEREGMTLPTALAGDGDPVLAAYRVDGYPTSYVLKADGTVAWRRLGFAGDDTVAELRDVLLTLGVGAVGAGGDPRP